MIILNNGENCFHSSLSKQLDETEMSYYYFCLHIMLMGLIRNPGRNGVTALRQQDKNNNQRIYVNLSIFFLIPITESDMNFVETNAQCARLHILVQSEPKL